MYFDDTPDQRLVRAAAGDFFRREVPISRVRALLDTATGFDTALWSAMGGLGWLGALVPVEHGGTGMSLLDLAPVLEESGRACAPAPLVEHAVPLPTALAAAGTPEQRERWLPRVARGDAVAALALGRRSAGGTVLDGIGVHAYREGDGWCLEGEAFAVPFGHVASVLLVPARATGSRGAEGISLFVVEGDARGVQVDCVPSLDPSYRLASVRFESVRVATDQAITDDKGAADVLQRVVDATRAAYAVTCVGGAGKVLDMAVGYATQRHQFGRPVGSFQAVKHRCANVCIRYELARSGAHYAAWSIAQQTRDAHLAAAMASAACTETFAFAAGEAIQVTGGVGFTWEYDLHFYYKRAKLLEHALGGPSEAWETVAAAL
jgi:alkylation response protein AidB-like acyl-CoA dehydrogenase